MYKPPTKEEFGAMTPEGQRVAIAKDVLELLESEKLIAECGTYLETSRYAACTVEQGAETIRIGQPCTVCAVGAWVLARHRMDGAHLEETTLPTQDEDALNMMEAQFEAFNDHDEWYKAYPVDNDRLRAIYENIIRNNGTFVAYDLGVTP